MAEPIITDYDALEAKYAKKPLARNLKIKSFKKIAAVVILLSCLIGIGFLSIENVPVGHSGVLLTLGRVHENTLGEGFHFIIPFVQRIVHMDNRIQKLEVYTQAFSIDIQTVSSRLAVNYQINAADSAEIFRTIGFNFERLIIEPAVHEVLKNVSAQYTAEELISLRARVSDEILAALNEEMQKHGIAVIALNIIDFDFTDDFIRAVEEKQIAEQRQQQADIENVTMILRAAADAEAITILAEAHAEALRITASGISESYRLQNQYVTDMNLILEWIAAWDGVMPLIQGADGGMMLDINALLP